MLLKTKLFSRAILALAMILTLLGTAPVLAQAPSTAARPATEGVRETRLKNGMLVLTREDHRVPVVALYIWYRVGSRNENFGTTGISHQLEHMMFKGTRKFPPGYISKVLSRSGSEYNAFTSTDFTAYYEVLPASRLETGLAIESDRMVNAVIDAEQLKLEKTVVLSEYEGGENDPTDLLYKAVMAAAFTSHPYHWSVIGFKSDIENYTPEALRKFYKTYYTPQNAVLVLVGDFDTAQALKKVESYFGRIPSGVAPPVMGNVEPPQRGERRVTVKGPGQTDYIQVAWHVPEMKHPDRYALAVMDSILTSGRSSRLYRALVEEEKVASDVGAWVFGPIDPGVYQVFITLKDKIPHQQAESALYRGLESLWKSPPSAKEIEKARNQVAASFIYSRDSLSSQAYTLGYYQTLGDYRYLDTYVERINQVTAQDVIRVAKTYLVADNRTVGWYAAQEKEESGGGGARPGSGPPGQTHLQSGIPSSGLVPPQALAYYRSPAATGMDPMAAYTADAGPQLPLAGDFIAVDTDEGTTREAGNRQRTIVRHTLSNGMVLLVQENHANPTVSISASLMAGSCFDPPGKAGLAAFVSSTLDEGAGKRTSQQIADYLDFTASSLYFSGGRNTIAVSGLTLTENFPGLLDLLADCLMRPTFPAQEVEKIRGIKLTSLQEDLDNPRMANYIRFYEALYPKGHPYHTYIAGYPETVKTISREDLLGFQRRYLRPDTTILAVVGDVDADQVKDMVEKRFATWKARESAPTYSFPAVSLPEKSQLVVIPMPDKSQVEIILGNIGFARTDPDFYKANLMNEILGGSTLSSRLGVAVRDKAGLAYGIYSYLTPSPNPAPFVIRLGVNTRNVDRALSETRTQLEKIRNELISAEELAWGRDTLINGLPVSLETNGALADMLINMEFYHLGLDYISDYPSYYRDITREEIREAARRLIYPDQMITVIAGPYQESAGQRYGQ